MRVLLVIVAASIVSVCYSSLSVNNGTFGEAIDGKGLIKLGRKLNKPMLTLVGMAIRNLRHDPCEQWTPWTRCDATRQGYFGSQTRNRSCSRNGDFDQTQESSEKETQICEGEINADIEVKEKFVNRNPDFCPDCYTLTSNGFCMKLNKTRVSNDEAVKQCKSEGGYLIHIDTWQKNEDCRDLLSGYIYNVHIDGRRYNSTSPWEYTHGNQTAYLPWYFGYPIPDEDASCLVFEAQDVSQYNYKCSFPRPFICEILKQ